MSKYPEAYSDVQVTFIDGEIRTYRISAGPGIGGYLAREAGSSGVLSLFNSKTGQSWAIPVGSIREWSVTQIPIDVLPVEAAIQKAPKPELYVSVRTATLAFLRENPEAWFKPSEIVPHICKNCSSNIGVHGGIYTALSSLLRAGLVDRVQQSYNISPKGLEHDA